jgi:hypothetical protein
MPIGAIARMPVPDHEPPVESYNSGAFQERHYALNWLIGYGGLDWDDISTDTCRHGGESTYRAPLSSVASCELGCLA